MTDIYDLPRNRARLEAGSDWVRDETRVMS